MTAVDQPSTRRPASASAGAFAITVSFELEEGAAEKFHPLVAENARQSVALEPACLRFDVPSCTIEMEGDAFEMEDQRNWADAWFKTYVRPLSKPRRYQTAFALRLIRG